MTFTSLKDNIKNMVETAREFPTSQDVPLTSILGYFANKGRERYIHMATSIMCNGAGDLIAGGSGRALISAIASYLVHETGLKDKFKNYSR